MVRLIHSTSRGWGLVVTLLLLTGCAATPTATQSPQPPGHPSGDPASTGQTQPTDDRAGPGSVVQPEPDRSLALGLKSQADAALARGDHDAAISILERAIRIDPDEPELWLGLSRVSLERGNYPAAEQYARKALLFTGAHYDLEQQAYQLIDAAANPR